MSPSERSAALFDIQASTAQIRQRSLGDTGARHDTSLNSSAIRHYNLNTSTGLSSSRHLLGRKHLSLTKSRHLASKDKKQAIKHLFKEIQSAALPEISTHKFKSINFKNRAAQDEKKIEYIHEEFFDT